MYLLLGLGSSLGKPHAYSSLSTRDNCSCSSPNEAVNFLRKYRRKNFCEQTRNQTGRGLFGWCWRSVTCAKRTQLIGSVTALTFSKSGLISASEDCTICIWDISSCEIIRRFNHHKGPVTNLAVIPQSSLLPVSNHRKDSDAFGVSVLDKYPQPANSSNEKITLFSPCHSLKGNQISINFQTTDFAAQQIQNMEKDLIAAMEMKLETCLEGRMRATKMVKHVMEMNRHLQSHLLGLARPIHLRRERARPSCLKIAHCKRGRSSHKSPTHLCSHVFTYFAN